MRALVLVFALSAVSGLVAQEKPKKRVIETPSVTVRPELPEASLRVGQEARPCSIPLLQINPIAGGLTPVIPAPENPGTIVMIDPPAPPCEAQSKFTTRLPNPKAPHSIEVTPETDKP